MGNQIINHDSIVLGLCAMNKKARSKPMEEILKRLNHFFPYISVVYFEEEIILHSPIVDWPLCDVLVSFYSEGFPLAKAIEYVKLREPHLVNDLESQYLLMDRVKVYQTLRNENIPVPQYAVLRRDSSGCLLPGETLVESNDYIEINGEVFHKPFVEKPVDAENHDIYIYFPLSAGGGSQRLFRKVNDRSSRYVDVSSIRYNCSYIYEIFMPTDGTDVKVYTVGDDYAHAEARKSPALDGKVERSIDGKEIRYPVILSQREKMIAKTVSRIFKQQICGFDLLRANGMTYVCDVNGFSFVKSSKKYYDDCGHILGSWITRMVAPHYLSDANFKAPIYLPEEEQFVSTTRGTQLELRSVVAVIRHGDRTPKQKLKMSIRHVEFFQLYNKYNKKNKGHQEVKLKKPTEMQECLDVVRKILMVHSVTPDPEIEEKKQKLRQMKMVLEMYGHFTGFNRKVQLKYQGKCITRATIINQFEKEEFINSPSQSFKQKSDAECCDCGTSDEPSILVIVKWGGELTTDGRKQAEELGKAFRCIYPGGEGNYGNRPGLGLLRLHSTYRHDLKIYASDEGRVQMTAAAFTKGFLALEGELPPILMQMVKSADTNGLLDSDNDSCRYTKHVKRKIQTAMSKDTAFTQEDYEILVPTKTTSIQNAMEFIQTPLYILSHIYQLMKLLNKQLKKAIEKPNLPALSQDETWDLMRHRWSKLQKDFYISSDQYDVAKIPDIYDNIKYDIKHNRKVLDMIFNSSEVYQDLSTCAKACADIVVPQVNIDNTVEYRSLSHHNLPLFIKSNRPVATVTLIGHLNSTDLTGQEYGITLEEKLKISQRICTPLLAKILSDIKSSDTTNTEAECTTRLDTEYPLEVSSRNRFVRTRLYFTSESHLHSLLTCLQYGGLSKKDNHDSQWHRAIEYLDAVPEINYLSQIVFTIYEDPKKVDCSQSTRANNHFLSVTV